MMFWQLWVYPCFQRPNFVLRLDRQIMVVQLCLVTCYNVVHIPRIMQRLSEPFQTSSFLVLNQFMWYPETTKFCHIRMIFRRIKWIKPKVSSYWRYVTFCLHQAFSTATDVRGLSGFSTFSRLKFLLCTI